MSIVTNMIRDLGIIESSLAKIGNLKLSIIRHIPFSITLCGSRTWASPSAAEEFRRNQITHRALDESMARLPLAR